MALRQPVALLCASALARVHNPLHPRILRSQITNTSYSLAIVNRGRLGPCFESDPLPARVLHIATALSSPKKASKALISNKHDEKGTTTNLTEVQLVGQHGEDLGTMTKKHAQRLADDQDLRLVRLDGESQNSNTYKLMTGRELADERQRLREIKKAEKKKVAKTSVMTSRISKHDLEIKTRQVLQWIEKGHEVTVTIKSATLDNNQAAVETFKYVNEQAKDVAVIRQAKKAEKELVYILRPKETEHVNQNIKPFTTEELKEMTSSDKNR